MTRFIRIAAASALLGTAFAHTALSQELRSVDDGGRVTVFDLDVGSNVVGGALTRIVGSGESAQVEVIAVQNVQRGPAARLVGNGENKEVVYQDDVPAPRFAQGGARG